MPLLPLSKTLISFEASEISSSPRERQRPSTGSRRWENPEAFDPIRDSFIFKNVAVEPSQERNNNLTGGPGKRQQTRPWTGVLYSSNGRPAAQRASQPAYRDMQPEVKQLFPLEDHPTWASKVSDNKDEPGSGQGLRALLAQSKSREQGVQNSPVGTGKGSRIARAEEDLEKRIQERMARLNAKSVPKHSVLTGWSIQRTKSSENTDIPTPTGNVTSIKTQEPPLKGTLKADPNETPSMKPSPPKKSKSASNVAPEDDVQAYDNPQIQKELLATGLLNLQDASDNRIQTEGPKSKTGKGSKFFKAQHEMEKRIQERMDRLKEKQKAKEENEKRAKEKVTGLVTHSLTQAQTEAHSPNLGTPMAWDGNSLDESFLQNTDMEESADDRIGSSEAPGFLIKTSFQEEMVSEAPAQGTSITDHFEQRALHPLKQESLHTNEMGHDCRGMVTRRDGMIYEGSIDVSDLDSPSRGDPVTAGSRWTDDSGPLVTMRSHGVQMHEENNHGAQNLRTPTSPAHTFQTLRQLSLERSISADSNHRETKLDQEIKSEGLVRLRSGNSESDLKLGVRSGSRKEYFEDGNVEDGISPADALRSNTMRWAQKLKLGACVLQRSMRCHHARQEMCQRHLLIDSNRELAQRRSQSMAIMTGSVRVLGKLTRSLAAARMAKTNANEDDLLIEAITHVVPKLRASFLSGRFQDFLNLLDVHEKHFEKVCQHVPPQVYFHFQESRSRANKYAHLISVANDVEVKWEPADSSQAPFAAASGQYVKVLNEAIVLEIQDGENAGKVARGISLFMKKVLNSAHMPLDERAVPKAGLAIKWLRTNDFNVAHSLQRYESLLKFSDSWAPGTCVDVWQPDAQDIFELESRGLRLLRAADGTVLQDPSGCAVALVDAHKVFDRNRYSIANAQALLSLFWNLLTEDFSQVVSRGMTVVVNMTAIHRHGGFCFTAARDLFTFVKEVFSDKMVKHICFYGMRGRYGAGFLTATKVVFGLVCSRVSYIDTKDGEEFCLQKVKDVLMITDITGGEGKGKSLKNLFKPVQLMQRTVSAFTRILSEYSQTIELERNNVAQQALLYRDGWYGHYPLDSREKDVQPFFEAGSSRLKIMRRKRDSLDVRDRVSVDEVKTLVGGVVSGAFRTRVVNAEYLAKACTGPLACHCRAEVSNYSGMQALSYMIEHGTSDEKGAASLAVAKACIGKQDNAQEAFDHGVVIPLINLINCGPEKIRPRACEALAEICWNYSPACEATCSEGGINTLVNVVRNGLAATQRQALFAIAAVCSSSETGRTICSLSDGWMVVLDCLRSPDISVQSAATRVMQALYLDVGDPHKIVKRVREMDGISCFLKILRSSDLEAERNSAAALAQGLYVDLLSLDFFLRGGGVHAMLDVCQRLQYVNKLIRAMTPDCDGKCRVEDLQETWAQHVVYRQNIDVEFLQDCIHMLSPEREDRVLICDWFDCQRSIVHALKFALHADAKHAEEASAAVMNYSNGVELLYTLCVSPQNYNEVRQLGDSATLQELALGALSGILKVESASMSVSDRLIQIRGVRPLLLLLKEGSVRLQTAVLWVLFYASMHSHPFREVAELNGIPHILADFKLQHKKKKSKHPGWAVAEKLHNMFMAEGVGGLLLTIQTGSSREAEVASAALWHLAAVDPPKKASLKSNPSTFGLLHAVANCKDMSADKSAMAAARDKNKSKRKEENLETLGDSKEQQGSLQVKSSFTENTRRNALNILKILGKAPMEAELEAKVPPAPVRRKKSKLRSFLNYQTTQQMHLVTEEVIVKGRPLKEDAK